MKLFYHRIRIEGLMPERALLKLKRNDIPLYDIKKTAKDRLECSIPPKYLEKLFSLYPSQGKNTSYTPFTATDLGFVGAGKTLKKLSGRIGFLLGGLLFCVISVTAQQFVFGVEFIGSSVYKRETLAALDEYGVKEFGVYQKGNEDLICAKLLSLSGVEFCSVQKIGTRIRVETRLYSLPPKPMQKGEMRAKRTGEIIAITTLRGTPAKKIGDKIEQGETLVHDWFFVEGKGQVSVEVIARVSVACVYEEELQAENKEQAFAKAYLSLALQESDTITNTQIEERETGFFVRIQYTAIQSINL